MNRIKKVGIAVTVAALVVGIGFYFSRPETVIRSTDGADKGTLETPGAFGDGWSFNPFGDSRNDRPSDETSSPSQKSASEIEKKQFTLTGRVLFPDGASHDTVQLQLRIRPLKLTTPQLRSLNKKLPPASRNLSRRELFRPIISVLGKDFLSKKYLRRTVSTDQSGHFKLTKAPPGIYEGTIVSNQWSGSLENPTVQLPGRHSTLRIQANQRAVLEGKIVSSEGEPLPDATVSVGYRGGNVTTGSDGTFRLAGLRAGGALNLEIKKEGFMPVTRTLKPFEPGEVRNRTFTVRPGVSLTVQVRRRDGTPVTRGRVGIARADTATRRENGYVGLNPKHMGGQGPSRAYPVNENGNVTMDGLHPGKVTFKYLSVPAPGADTDPPHFMSKQKTVTLKRGKQNETTLTVFKGKKFWINIVDAQTGEALTEHDVNSIRVLDAEGNPMKQALGPWKESTHKFSGRVDPRAAKIEVSVQPRGVLFPSEPQNYRRRTKTFSMSDLPELTVELQPTEDYRSAGRTTGGLMLHLVEPFDTKNDGWPERTQGRLFVLDGSSGRILAARGGSSNPFNQPLRVPSGQHYVYGTLKHDGKRYAFFDRVQALKNEIVKKNIRAREAATLEGNIQTGSGDKTAGYQLTLTFNQFDGSAGASTPDPLTVDAAGESFQFKYVPPGVAMTLKAHSPGSGSSRTLPGLSRNLSNFSPGETRSVTID